MKLLHTADIHLDSPLRSLALRNAALRDTVQAASRIALTRIVDAALSENVAAVLIAGDLFDGQERSAKTAAFLIGQLERLRPAGIQVFYIKGNHDAENPVTGEVTLPDHVHVFDGRGGKVQIGNSDVFVHGISFSGRHAPDSLLPKFGAPVAGAVNIAMLHSSLAGASGHDTYAPCSVSELAGMGFDYWALGHVHKRQVHGDKPWIVMPGIPQGRDIGEADTKTATLLTIEDGTISVSEIVTSHVEFRALEIDTSQAADGDALRRILRQSLRDEAERLQSDHAILRVTLAGRSPIGWTLLRDHEVWEETLAGLAEETGRLWIEKVRFDIDLAPGGADTPSAVGELQALMQAIEGETSFQTAILAEAEEMLALLPPDRRQDLLREADSGATLARALAETGARHVTALMKGSA
ncbi:metallophosphoesterase family protein [Rhizobium halophytocola]|uniref:DNA repair exonuclease SbcCD nuclease subunit n=1 Tax=Rhizobium halophytocola TaxID=735519 RepID=A0ABS4DVD8_9HYPH|nr:DNA repair exonuclease [Rhizobium halophytocola]MBP1849655.1 DNA repair exonuclease SbcCD nuclease subunit [Rhizobium halophytocola]